MAQKPKLKYMRDYSCTSLWTANDEARAILHGYNVSYSQLNLSPELVSSLKEMDEEYSTQIDWNDPGAGLQWDEAHVNDYNLRSDVLYNRIVEEIGDIYDIENLEKISKDN